MESHSGEEDETEGQQAAVRSRPTPTPNPPKTTAAATPPAVVDPVIVVTSSTASGSGYENQTLAYGSGNYQSTFPPLPQPPMAASATSANHHHAAEDDDEDYNEEARPLLGPSRTPPSKRRQWAFNLFMVGAFLATIGLIITLVVLSSNSASTDGGGPEEPGNVTMKLGAAAAGAADYDDDGGGTTSMDEESLITEQVLIVQLNETTNGTTTTRGTTTVAATTAAPTTTTTPEPPLDPAIQIEIDQGILQGKKLNSTRGGTGNEYLAFLGIPYALPPVGELRFAAPVEADVWEGTRNATNFMPTCPEFDEVLGAVTGEEDCLYLNVYTPRNSSELGGNGGRGGGGNRGGGGGGGGRGGGGGGGGGRGRRQQQYPVIVVLGDSSRISPDYFIGHKVVLVTLESRVGIFGTLNLNVTNAAGNQGLKDQVMALQWVKDNIGAFGGNRRKVTLLGRSGVGSIAVTAHMLSPLSDGLFKRAIVNSGTVLQPGVFVHNLTAMAEAGFQLGARLNCTTASATADNANGTGTATAATTGTPPPTASENLLNCLLNASAHDLASIFNRTVKAFRSSTLTVDSASETDSVFLPQPPATLLQSGSLKKMPLIIGTLSNSIASQQQRQQKPAAPVVTSNETEYVEIRIKSAELATFLQLPETNNSAPILEEIERFYFGNETAAVAGDQVNNNNNGTAENSNSSAAATAVAARNAAILTNLTSLGADRLFNHPALAIAEAQFQVNNASTGRFGGGGGGGGARGGGGGGGGGFGGIFGDLFGNNGGNGVYLFYYNATATGTPNGTTTTTTASSEDDFWNAGNVSNNTEVIVSLWASFADSGIPTYNGTGTSETGTGVNVTLTWTPINNQTKPYKALQLNYGSATATNATNFQMVDFFSGRMDFWNSFNLTDLYY